MMATTRWRARLAALLVVLALLAAACGDDSGGDGDEASGGDESAAEDDSASADDPAAVEAWCAAFTDQAWFDFFGDDGVPDEAAGEALAPVNTALRESAPASIEEDTSRHADGVDGVITAWSDAGYDEDAVDRAALTDASIDIAETNADVGNYAAENCEADDPLDR
jgi:hypothetical protein